MAKAPKDPGYPRMLSLLFRAEGHSLRTRILHRLLRLKHSLSIRLGGHPGLWRPLVSLSRWKRDRLLVKSGTELVIEGFPRSANSFAVVAFLMSQSRDVSVAHHLHSPAQIIWAVRRGIPAVLLIRDPLDAAVSMCIRHPYMTVAQTLNDWIRFHRFVLPHRDGLVVGLFEEVTGRCGRIFERANQRFGTEFGIFEHTDENKTRCFELLDEYDRAIYNREDVGQRTVSRPTDEKAALAGELRKQADHPGHRSLMAEARELYAALTSGLADTDVKPKEPESPGRPGNTTD